MKRRNEISAYVERSRLEVHKAIVLFLNNQFLFIVVSMKQIANSPKRHSALNF